MSHVSQKNTDNQNLITNISKIITKVHYENITFKNRNIYNQIN